VHAFADTAKISPSLTSYPLTIDEEMDDPSLRSSVGMGVSSISMRILVSTREENIHCKTLEGFLIQLFVGV